MDCRPDCIETLLYTWGVFGLIAGPSFAVAERLMDRYAVRIARRADGGGAGDGARLNVEAARDIAASVRALNLSLVLYALLLTCLFVLLGCIVVYSGASLLHLCVEAVFRTEQDGGTNGRAVRQMMHAADNLLDPSLVFGFLSIRMWNVHAAVLVATFATTALYTWLLLTPARMLAMLRVGNDTEGGGGEGGLLSADLVAGAFRETYGFAASAMVMLYLTVVSREIVLFIKLQEKG